MKRFLIICMSLCGVATAQNMTVTWTAPTTYTNGSALSPADIAGYDLTCRFTPTGGTGGACTLSKTSLAGGTATTDSLTATIPAAGGQLCIKLTTRLKSARISTESAEACKTFEPLDPNPPTGIRVVNVDVRLLRLDRREIALGETVGSVPLGTLCGKVAVVGNYRSVARSNVRLRTPQPAGTVLVALCG